MRVCWLTPIGLLLCAAGCATEVTADQREQFEATERAFAEADSPTEYLQVAGTYQSLIDSGLKSSAVLFNQGNAFMQAEQPARAIACYRQALRYSPADSAIRSNLQVALGRTGGADPPEDWFRKLFFWQDWIGYATKFQLATGLLILTSVLLIASCIAANRSIRTCGVVFAIATIVSMISAGYDWSRFERQQEGVIISETKALKGNGTNYEPAFSATLTEGVEFVIREHRGDWLRIAIPQIGEGWVQSEAVVIY